MANEVQMTLCGNLTADPEIRYSQNGIPVANFTIAQTPRTFDKSKNEWVDGEAIFIRCSVWRDYAENAAATLTKGMRVIATGRFKVRSWEDKEGNKRTSNEMEVDEIGPSLRYAQAAVQRVQRDSSMTRQQPPADDPYAGASDEAWATPQPGAQQQAPAQAADDWAAQGDAFKSETPF